MPVDGNDLAGDQPQALRAAVLQPRFKKKLHPQTDAQQRCAGRGAGAERLEQPLFLQAAHRVGKRADAGQDQPVRRFECFGGSADPIRHAQTVERVADRMEIAHRIIDNRQHKIPFVESTPPVRNLDAV